MLAVARVESAPAVGTTRPRTATTASAAMERAFIAHPPTTRWLPTRTPRGWFRLPLGLDHVPQERRLTHNHLECQDRVCHPSSRAVRAIGELRPVRPRRNSVTRRYRSPRYTDRTNSTT